MSGAKNRDQHTSVEDFGTFEMFLMGRVDQISPYPCILYKPVHKAYLHYKIRIV